MSSTPSSNVVTITDQSGTLSSPAYAGAYDATSGQSCTPPPTIVQSGNKFTITFLCDRKGSDAVATSFNGSCGGASYEYAASGGGGTPGSLNFYFGLTAVFNTAQGQGTAMLYLGQGNYSLTNNWWIGGSVVQSSVPNLDIPIGSASQKLYLPLSGDHDSFNFGLGTIGS